MKNCPCGSENDYGSCCEPIITGKKSAETAEQLMRARYTAHEKVEIDFLFNSTHPEYRKDYDHDGTKVWAENSEWHGLEIVETALGGAKDEEGEAIKAAAKEKRKKAGVEKAKETRAKNKNKGRNTRTTFAPRNVRK